MSLFFGLFIEKSLYFQAILPAINRKTEITDKKDISYTIIILSDSKVFLLFFLLCFSDSKASIPGKATVTGRTADIQLNRIMTNGPERNK